MCPPYLHDVPNPSGGDRVHADALLAQVKGRALGELVHRAFGGVVRPAVRLGDVCGDGADVDDRPRRLALDDVVGDVPAE